MENYEIKRSQRHLLAAIQNNRLVSPIVLCITQPFMRLPPYYHFILCVGMWIIKAFNISKYYWYKYWDYKNQAMEPQNKLYNLCTTTHDSYAIQKYKQFNCKIFKYNCYIIVQILKKRLVFLRFFLIVWRIFLLYLDWFHRIFFLFFSTKNDSHDNQCTLFSVSYRKYKM